MAARFLPAIRTPVYVCVCNGVTDRDIRAAAAHGCRGLPELTMRTGCGATCGSCVDAAIQLLDEEAAKSAPARGLHLLAVLDAA